jgi:hypothetical protein
MSETENNIENTEQTTAPVETTENEGRTFTQADMDKVVADRVSRERRKYEKKYEGVDVDQYQELIQKAEKEKQDKLKAKGEFEQILKDTVSKKDEQINSLLNQVKTIKVDSSLLDTASQYKAVNPQQVSTLLKDQVRLNEAGDVEIVDPKTQQVRYNDKGEHLSVSELVNEFLTANPHFVAATPAGAGTTGKVGNVGSGEKFDITKLDMNNAEDRAKYAEYRKQNGLR